MTSRLDRYTCEEALRRLDDYVDRELGERELQLVREHLETCAACTAQYTYQVGAIEQLKEKLRRIAVPQDLLTRIRDTLRKSAS
jgi:anti-sigma factor (TIGR02949 family)